MTILKTNLNLVPVLRALLRERSVSGAAMVLGRSPSSVSESLSQLRTILGDQLLVRVGSHLQLTARAAALVNPLEDAYEHLNALFRNVAFDASTSTRTFTIASSDLLISEIGPDIIKTLRAEAPQMSLIFVDVANGLTEKMASREIDFALLPEFAIADLAPAPLRFKSLCETKLAALMSRNHPLAGKRSVTMDDMRAYRHIGFQPDAVLLERRRGRESIESSAFDLQGGFNLAVTVNQFLTIPRLLEGTDLVALVPAQILQASVLSAIVIAVPLEYQVEGIVLGLAWSPVFDGDDAHAWLRKQFTKRRRPELSMRKQDARA